MSAMAPGSKIYKYIRRRPDVHFPHPLAVKGLQPSTSYMWKEDEDGLLTSQHFNFEARLGALACNHRSSEGRGHKSLFVRFVIPESANAKRHVPDGRGNCFNASSSSSSSAAAAWNAPHGSSRRPNGSCSAAPNSNRESRFGLMLLSRIGRQQLQRPASRLKKGPN